MTGIYAVANHLHVARAGSEAVHGEILQLAK